MTYVKLALLRQPLLRGQFFWFEASQCSDLLNRAKFRQCVDCRFDEGYRIICPVRLCQDIMDASRFANSTDCLPGDDTRTSTRWNEDYLGSTVVSPDLVRDGTLDKRNIDQTPTGLFLSFLYAGRNFVRFTVAPTNLALAVTDNNHGCETESATTFDHCSAAFDFYNTVEHAFGDTLFLVLVPLFSWCVTNGSILFRSCYLVVL